MKPTKEMRKILAEAIRKEYNGVAWREAFIKGNLPAIRESLFDFEELLILYQNVSEAMAKKIFNEFYRYGHMSCSCKDCSGAWGICDSNFQKLKKRWKVK